MSTHLWHRAAVSLLGLAASALAGAAHADTRTVPGHALVLTITQSDDVTITTEPSLVGALRFTRQGSVSCLSVSGGDTVELSTAGACDGDQGTLHIQVPQGTPLTLNIDASGNVLAGDMSGPVTVAINGSGDFKAGNLSKLTLTSHGNGDALIGNVTGQAAIESFASGDVRMGVLHGDLTVSHMGSGDVAIGSIAAGTVSIEQHSSGDIIIGGGAIARLHAALSGSGDMAVAAVVQDADVQATGGGDVKLGQVLGSIRRDASGGSDIVVGGSALVSQIVAQAAKAAASAEQQAADAERQAADAERQAGEIGRDAASTGASYRHHSAASGSTAAHVVGHLVTMLIGGIVLFLIWRIVSRAGGFPGFGGRTGQGPSPSAAPTNPGVVAFAEAMGRLDQRLGRVEGYVTTKEFELQQKFRDLDRA